VLVLDDPSPPRRLGSPSVSLPHTGGASLRPLIKFAHRHHVYCDARS
jgi:hypothetical protein